MLQNTEYTYSRSIELTGDPCRVNAAKIKTSQPVILEGFTPALS
jgi:hypothetical protein